VLYSGTIAVSVVIRTTHMDQQTTVIHLVEAMHHRCVAGALHSASTQVHFTLTLQ